MQFRDASQWKIMVQGVRAGDIPSEEEFSSVFYWWVLIVKAKGPEGPFTYMPEHAPEPFMNPTGFVENPMITKMKGPVTGKEYWTVIFDFLQPEVTTGNNSQLGFNCSTDGLTWPVENAQIIDMDKGLPA